MILHIDGRKVYYEAAGDGRPVVLLHGWGTDSGNMRPVLKQIRENLPRRVIALDFPGFGYSDPPPTPWAVADYGRWLVQALDALGLDQADLVAHSFGGRVAIWLASEAPQRIGRLALVDSAGIRPKRTLGYHLKVAWAKALKRVLLAAPELGRRLGLERAASRQGSEDYRQAGFMRGTFVRVVNEDLSDRLSRICSPTLLIWGEADTSTPLADAQRMNALIAGSRLVVIPGAGHFPYLEQPVRFADALIPFLSP